MFQVYLFIVIIFYNSFTNKFTVFSSKVVKEIGFILYYYYFQFYKNSKELSTIILTAFSLGKQKIPLEIATNDTDQQFSNKLAVNKAFITVSANNFSSFELPPDHIGPLT
eukprot:TRINITY_DN5139_c0_g1_i2.p3 TRINITY_DN5139_c0_g1~~TRINITY_DN5139_c0_g1_i2.p3  ORF type:complete len:110 (+),score=11.29 TRINITY_DN5139_c0_g1_i2:18-347(+)